MDKRLQVSFVDDKPSYVSGSSNKTGRSEEMRAVMERMWRRDPEQFNPLRNCSQKERIEKTLHEIRAHLSLQGKQVADLGCGSGHLSRLLRDQGAHVDAVDIASQALLRLKEHNTDQITPIQDCLPTTKLKDDHYDLVVCTEVIAYLHPKDYRLLMSELSRVMKPNGLVCFSTPLDTDTEDPIDNLSALAETEFSIESWTLSHHSIWERICKFFEYPRRFVRLRHDKEFAHENLKELTGLKRYWTMINSTPPLVYAWQGLSFLANPIAHFCRNSTTLLHLSEKLSHFFWIKSGITHAIFIGRRRPLTHPLPENEIPKEHKQKRFVWE